MTDDRIAELLGWQPERRTWRDSSLMHRIRLIVAEAQAEQDGHIYRLREQIARLRAALDELGVAIADAGYTWTPAMRTAYEKGTK